MSGIDIRVPTQYASLAYEYLKSVTINATKWQSGHYALLVKCHGKLNVPLCSLLFFFFPLLFILYVPPLCTSCLPHWQTLDYEVTLPEKASD